MDMASTSPGRERTVWMHGLGKGKVEGALSFPAPCESRDFLVFWSSGKQIKQEESLQSFCRLQ